MKQKDDQEGKKGLTIWDSPGKTPPLLRETMPVALLG